MAKMIQGGSRLKSYMKAPWDATKAVLLNVIRHPLYTFANIAAAAPPSTVNIFQQTIGSSNLARTNLEQAGILPYPKTFWIRGVRVHALQDIPFVDDAGQNARALARLIEQYAMILKVGEKEFIRCGLWYFTSGLGVNFQAAAAGAEAANELFSTEQIGVPHHGNYFKIPPTLEIVIPPQQGFSGVLNNAGGIATLGAGAADRVLQILLEGALGRETQ